MRHVAVVASLLALLPCAGHAADKQGQFAVRGAGLISCAVFAQEQAARGDVYKIVSSWVDGYVTGVNQYAPDTYDLLSFETTELLMAILDRHCRVHPTDPVFGVLMKLFDQLKADRLREKSTKLTLSKDKREATHYVELVRRVQRKLQKHGLYHGDIDGEFNPDTSRAIASFQKSIGFEPTGFPDQTTLWRLLRGD